MKRSGHSLLILFAGFALLCGHAWAGPTWICSISYAVAATDEGEIGPPDLGRMEAPAFLRVDSDAMQITILAPASRRGEVSRIDTLQRNGEAWLLSGMERGRIWCMTISDAGHVTLSMVDDGEVWAVFGNALLEEDLHDVAESSGE